MLKIIIVAVAMASSAFPVRAQEKAAPPQTVWGDFFKNLRDNLSQSAVAGERKKGRSVTSLAAVRGASQRDMADPNEPTLKGDSKSAKVKKERALDDELAASVELVTKGKLEEGLKGLEAFKTAHPKHRSGDVEKAIEGAKSLIAETAAKADQ
ncbi:MAG: hypothetical protein AAB036_01085 [Elusimicrobiota bacterium]